MLGGPHVTLMPDEAQDHADVIFIGVAEALPFTSHCLLTCPGLETPSTRAHKPERPSGYASRRKCENWNVFRFCQAGPFDSCN